MILSGGSIKTECKETAMNKKMKKQFNVFRIFKRIQCIEKQLKDGFTIKSHFSELERVPLSDEKKRRLEIDKDYLIRQLGKFVYISKFQNVSNGPAQRAIIEETGNFVYVSSLTGHMTV